MWIFIGIIGLRYVPTGLIPTPITFGSLNTILMKQPDVKPYRRVECTMLVNTQPCQVTIEVFTILRRLEIPVCNAPI